MNEASNLSSKISAILDVKLESENTAEAIKEIDKPLIQYNKLIENIRIEEKLTSIQIVKASVFKSTRTLLILITWGNLLLYPVYLSNIGVANYYSTNCINYTSIGSVKCRLSAHVINLCQNDLADFIYKVWVSLFSNLISIIHNPL
jgi:hypothetical protein